MIITRRNVDAAALNTAARVTLRLEGHLQDANFVLPAIDRAKRIVSIELAKGDKIRFSENLPMLGIRNGTRGTVEKIVGNVVDPHLTVRLDDGRLIKQQWTSLVRERTGRVALPPRISLAYAGTAYSVQGRTSAAAVLYIAKPTDAREVYVGLTRHTVDARVIVEQNRLAAVVKKNSDESQIYSDERDTVRGPICGITSLCREAKCRRLCRRSPRICTYGQNNITVKYL